jgi:hypothetical protein
MMKCCSELTGKYENITKSLRYKRFLELSKKISSQLRSKKLFSLTVFKNHLDRYKV